MTSFESLPLRPETRAALTAMAVTTPTPIQTAALPEMLAGRDVIGQARTGSGKTLAFAVPIVERVDERRRDVQALVLVPTRELASQVASVIRETARGRSLQVLLVVGGMSPGPQRQALQRGVQVVVGTPGRILDHINGGALRLDRLALLILDEADEMLDRGFAPDVERIIARTSPERQTALFSATVPDWVSGMAARHLRTPASIRVDADAQPVEHVLHTAYNVDSGGKLPALRSLLDARSGGSLLVFGRTKHGVRKLARQLEGFGYPVGALQGNLSQNARDRVMADFRSGQTPILIATNVAARGIDVENVAQVINYELPETADLLTHRVGRTGRMGREGQAITLLAPEDEPAWRTLLRGLRRPPVRRRWTGRHDSENVEPALTDAPVAASPPPKPSQAAISRPAPQVTHRDGRQTAFRHMSGPIRAADRTATPGNRPANRGVPPHRTASAPARRDERPTAAPIPTRGQTTTDRRTAPVHAAPPSNGVAMAGRRRRPRRPASS